MARLAHKRHKVNWGNVLPRSNYLGPLFCGGLALVIALAFQSLTVAFNAGGNWTALYHTGELTTLPPQLAEEDIYQFAGEPGYDGQYYHYIAHDPAMRHGFERFVDNPQLRWRRILIPGLAFLLSFGQHDYVDSVYFAIVLAFTGFGAFCLSALAERAGQSPWWGLGFLLVPAVAVSLDRMTVDVALAACCVALLLWAQRPLVVLPILAAAALARETGVLLALAYGVWSARNRGWKGVVIAAGSLVPFAVWTAYIHARTGTDQTTWSAFIPFWGLAWRTWHPWSYEMPTSWLRWAGVLDYVGVFGVWLALAIVFRRLPRTLAEHCAFAFGILASLLSKPDIWADVYAYGRTMSPLLLFVAWEGIRSRWWLFAVPMAVVVPRIIYQFGPQWKGVLRGIHAAAF
ncbi:MAG TPA: hypothetical protein VE621_10255 [Bryobacteraceae bacterium]|nr:hypothetical protein [Bryobacteraceae bacterium]